MFLSKPLNWSCIFLSNESTAASTAIMEKIPIVTPNKDRNVRNLLFRNALMANEKLSLNSRK